MHAPFCRWNVLAAVAFLGLIVDGGSLRLRAQDVAKQPVIELPVYTVTETRALPPPESWSYAHIDGFEVLSNAPDRETKKLLRDFQRFHQALTKIAMPNIEPPTAVPNVLIICGRGGKFDAFKPRDDGNPEHAMASFTLRGREFSAIVIDFQAKVISLSTPESLAAASRPDGASNTDFGVDSYKQLYREYVHFLIDSREPPPPAWLVEGLAQILMGIQVSKNTVAVGRIEDPNLVSAAEAEMISMGATGSAPQEDRDFNAALNGRALLPMDELFAVEHDSPEASNPLGSTWAKQCYAFVHWAIYGENGRHQKAFLAFASRLGNEPPSEEVFKECFKMSYADMGTELRSYIQFTAYQSAEFRARKGQQIPEPPPFELRAATESEVGRLTGDVLHLAGREEAAHLALIAPYIHGERDPQLLAALGLHERARGDDARARKFLEAAAQARAVRARAYLELARLRLTEARAAGGGQLNPEQMTSVLRPLFTARAQPPPLPEVYEFIADAWSRSAIAPTAANLGVLDEGVRMFPRDATLAYRDAALKVKIGLSAEAAVLVELGLRIATDGATREGFMALKAPLPPSPPSSPPAK